MQHVFPEINVRIYKKSSHSTGTRNNQISSFIFCKSFYDNGDIQKLTSPMATTFFNFNKFVNDLNMD